MMMIFFELVEMEIRELLSEYDFPGDDIPVIKGSQSTEALAGTAKYVDAIKELMDAVDTTIPAPQRDVDKPFLMPVEDVFSISGRGTVSTGRIESGIVKVGEEVEIVGIKETTKTTVTGVEMFRKLLDEGQAGDNVGLLLRGVKREDIERGQVLCKPGSITPHTKFKAEIYVLKKKKVEDIPHSLKDTDHNFTEQQTLLVISSCQKVLRWSCLVITSL